MEGRSWDFEGGGSSLLYISRSAGMSILVFGGCDGLIELDLCGKVDRGLVVVG
jgi:hypothetical protein